MAEPDIFAEKHRATAGTHAWSEPAINGKRPGGAWLAAISATRTLVASDKTRFTAAPAPRSPLIAWAMAGVDLGKHRELLSVGATMAPVTMLSSLVMWSCESQEGPLFRESGGQLHITRYCT
jgi:hypothetical protein